MRSVSHTLLLCLLAVLAIGCATSAVPVGHITEPVAEGPAPLAPPLNPDEAWHTFVIEEEGLSLTVPSGWFRVEPGYLWGSDVDQTTQLGVQWADLQPPAELEALLLPEHAVVLSREPVDLGWAEGARYMVEVYAPAAQDGAQGEVTSVQSHLLVVVDRDVARRAYDVYLVAESAERLEGMDELWGKVTESLRIGD